MGIDPKQSSSALLLVLALALAGCAARGKDMKMALDDKGAGDPLVLIGGGLTGWLSWERHQTILASTRRVARLQPLSVQYGLENRPLPPGYSVKLESQALAAALDDQDLHAPVDLVAWSFGAVVTLDFALDNPQRVRTLTLIEPPAVWVLRATGAHGRPVRAGDRRAPRASRADAR